MAVQQFQQGGKVGVDASVRDGGLVHQGGGQGDAVGAGQGGQRDGGVGHGKPGFGGAAGQHQSAAASGAGGGGVQKGGQVGQFGIVQQAGGTGGKAGHIFGVVPDQQRGVFL